MCDGVEGLLWAPDDEGGAFRVEERVAKGAFGLLLVALKPARCLEEKRVQSYGVQSAAWVAEFGDNLVLCLDYCGSCLALFHHS